MVPSFFTKKKLSKAFELPASKISVTYEAADEIFNAVGEQEVSEGKVNQVLSRYGVHKPFVIYVGAAFPYKNLDRLLSALLLLPKEIKLVYASSRSTFVERLIDKAREIGISDRLVAAGFVPNEDLAILYKQAECLVFPSLSEGFGLPGLEAMAAGCPVVCSDIPVFKEVYGEAAVYFGPKEARDMANKLELIIKNEKLKIKLREKGFEQAKKYSWRRMAEETLDVYRKAVI